MVDHTGELVRVSEKRDETGTFGQQSNMFGSLLNALDCCSDCANCLGRNIQLSVPLWPKLSVYQGCKYVSSLHLMASAFKVDSMW